MVGVVVAKPYPHVCHSVAPSSRLSLRYTALSVLPRPHKTNITEVKEVEE